MYNAGAVGYLVNVYRGYLRYCWLFPGRTELYHILCKSQTYLQWGNTVINTRRAARYIGNFEWCHVVKIWDKEKLKARNNWKTFTIFQLPLSRVMTYCHQYYDNWRPDVDWLRILYVYSQWLSALLHSTLCYKKNKGIAGNEGCFYDAYNGIVDQDDCMV